MFLPWTKVDFLSRLPVEYKGGYVPIMVRHDKLLESMRWSDKRLSPIDGLTRLLQLRDSLAGTPNFQKADKAFRRLCDSLRLVHKDDPLFLAVLKNVRSEEVILDLLAGFYLPVPEQETITTQPAVVVRL
jgi:hypothetical protein